MWWISLKAGENGVKQLLALTNGRTDGGLDDLKTFNTDTSESAYQELISKTWKLVNCVEEYHHKLWLKMSKKILHNNKIIMHMFLQRVMQTLLELGQGKNRNILLVSPANYGKTFLLDLLTEIWHSLRSMK